MRAVEFCAKHLMIFLRHRDHVTIEIARLAGHVTGNGGMVRAAPARPSAAGNALTNEVSSQHRPRCRLGFASNDHVGLPPAAKGRGSPARGDRANLLVADVHGTAIAHIDRAALVINPRRVIDCHRGHDRRKTKSQPCYHCVCHHFLLAAPRPMLAGDENS
ncbi:hypothetical protein ACFOKI_01900 [Sphingomonas qilianensis]|uniref:Uncharacterized protein n=1 Tax=Sphingomonas qilianensis TaxID=1736690 RepID=A0ABU9XS41_9SPHN